MTFSAETTAPPAEARGMEERLHELISRGYQFVHPTDAEGAVVAVVGVRVHDDVVDVVKLHAENDVHAVRMPGDEADIMAPDTVLWQSTGTVHEVLDKLIALPDEYPSGALASSGASAVNGCWVPVGTGTSTWLRSSGGDSGGRSGPSR
ncbi:hypothetical protein H0B56_18375 [Haloechinothrix sp. YIM 98757]|uniref:Uncharacterized protein n=1 Tax=Haloechinothrix aidingensis TaxID=2752311 RepID=A0A838AED8_9PSEU|nr:hypothetical protein [Haloechinothrix aidingensis]MBA0127515.1 hypothetical protein [Haloechinothrix aidingensis]